MRGDVPKTPVGMTARMDELVLPGSLLKPRPADVKTPLVLRIARSFPHGTAFRYDLVYYGLDPGSYDLRDYLKRADGSPTTDLPPLPVEITSTLPPGQIRPTAPSLKSVPGVGGYRLALILGSATWIVGLLLLIVVRRRRVAAAAAAEVNRSSTLEERLRALVEGALKGELSPRKRAELELALVERWRKELNLEGLSHADAFARLRRHADAGPLIEKLEEWLHRPGEKRADDLEAWLGRYRSLLPIAVAKPEPAPRAAPR